MKVEIFTTPTCGYCHQAKRFLADRGVVFTEYDVSRDREAADEMVRRTGQMGVPVIVIDGQVVIGFDRTRLEQLITSAGTHQQVSLGLKVANMSRSSEYPGAYVGTIALSSPAERAGLLTGDIIVRANASRVSNVSDLERILSGLQPGSRLSLGFVRKGQTMQSEITV
jgi:glutaredoxin 3